jgi:transcriptional regulator with GAF, ATPase, and Fis domain
LESELFGHDPGAFTGAARAHRGFFEQAGRGTIFLDEIGEISPRLQVALLRVLESGEIRPVGGSASRRVACRVLAATNADLQRLAEAGRFRMDLLFRLRGLEISVPPVRERREDILPLMEHFLSADRMDRQRPVLAPEVKDVLLSYEWPGNVRELRSTAELMRLLNSDGPRYEKETLDLALPEARRVVRPRESPPPCAAQDPEAVLTRSRASWRQVDRLRVLFQRHGKLNRAEAARMLGVTPKTATGYLKTLCRDGVIRKVMPTPSPRSHHFAVHR